MPEDLGRGVAAVQRESGEVFVSWRLLARDPNEVGFHVYRQVEGRATCLTGEPLFSQTGFVDEEAPSNGRIAYFVTPVIDGKAQAASKPFSIAVSANPKPYLSIPLETPPGTTPNDVSVGDLDGDGGYELVLKQAPPGRDNAHAGFTDPTYLQAYELDGTLLWTINLGVNIRSGAHYTQFMVFDFDGDGKAEVACKTADGTVDGTGQVIGDAQADHRNQAGYVLAGPEFLTVFDGETGRALATEHYIPPRHPDTQNPTPEQLEAVWGDGYGNRVDRFLAAVAYLDGERPSLVMGRGYYTRTVLAAWNWRGGNLEPVWIFDSAKGGETNQAYAGQGYHSLSVADVDSDGRDEILYGACAIDDDGTGLYATGLGHGDAMHVSDIDPTREGFELFGIHENPQHAHGANLRDARTGEIIWSLPLPDTARGLAMDIDPRYPGYECWTNNSDGLYAASGRRIGPKKPSSCNMGIWWDGDLLREILDGGRQGEGYIGKWNHQQNRMRRLLDGGLYDCVVNNGSKANPCLVADIVGDWREEVLWRTREGDELRLFTSDIPTTHRMVSLMQDHVYRLSIAWQNVGYNQPPHPGFYLGAPVEPASSH